MLRGHIALATARFPRGTTGAQLDTLARQFLWQARLDYDHGTGHGVGHYLNVHEGPQRISRPGPGAALRPGMVVSNEPGYYKTGAYGIRIENLVAVTEGDEAENGFLGFETLTLAPIDRALIEPGMLTAGRACLARRLPRPRGRDPCAPARGRCGDARLAQGGDRPARRRLT